MDILWLLFLAGLAALPPVRRSIAGYAAAIGVVQFSEGWLLARSPRRGAAYIVLLKIARDLARRSHGRGRNQQQLLADLFSAGVTAAEYFSPVSTLVWTALASAAYCSYPLSCAAGLRHDDRGLRNPGDPILFFFLAAMVVTGLW